MIYDELKDDDLSESVDNDGSDRQTKTIPLYDFAVCAGNGDFIDDTYVIIKRGKKNYYVGKKN